MYGSIGGWMRRGQTNTRGAGAPRDIPPGRGRVLDSVSANLPEDGHDPLSFPLPERKQIQVACRAKRIVEPCGIKHRSFQDEPFLVRRYAQPEQEPFQRVSRQHPLETRPVRPGHVVQPRTHRSSHVTYLTRHRRRPFRGRASEPTRCACPARIERSPPALPSPTAQPCADSRAPRRNRRAF